MKKRNIKNEKNIWIGLILFTTIAIIVTLVSMAFNKPEIERQLNKEGYKTTEDDAFYKKVTTNNTLDDFYNKMANNEDTAYEEYYLQKESLNFIELKMTYQNQVSRTLNITSDLRTNKVEFNYELSYKQSHIILEGNSDEDYNCKIVVRRNVNDDDASKQCDYIIEEMSTFLERRNQILQNEKVQELLSSPITEYVEE